MKYKYVQLFMLASYAVLGGGQDGHGGDPLTNFVNEARESAITLVSSLTADDFSGTDYAELDFSWETTQAKLLTELKHSPIEIIGIENKNKKCASTGGASKSKITLSKPTCKFRMQKPNTPDEVDKEALSVILIGDSFHHLGISDDDKSSQLAVKIKMASIGRSVGVQVKPVQKYPVEYGLEIHIPSKLCPASADAQTNAKCLEESKHIAEERCKSLKDFDWGKLPICLFQKHELTGSSFRYGEYVNIGTYYKLFYRSTFWVYEKLQEPKFDRNFSAADQKYGLPANTNAELVGKWNSWNDDMWEKLVPDESKSQNISIAKRRIFSGFYMAVSHLGVGEKRFIGHTMCGGERPTYMHTIPAGVQHWYAFPNYTLLEF